MSEARIINTPDLITLIKKAHTLDMKRKAPEDFVDLLDPDRFHIGTIQLWGHNMDQDRELVHRIFFWCALRGRDAGDPVELMLDMLGEDWEKIPTVGEKIR